MNFDTVKTGGNRIGGGATEILDNAGDLARFERPRCRYIHAKAVVHNVLVSALMAEGATGGLPTSGCRST